MFRYESLRTRMMTPPSPPNLTAPRRILMTRSLQDCGPVAALLQPLGDAVVHCQPFTTRPQSLSPSDAALLLAAAADKTATLALTSPRSVEALVRTAPDILAAWRQRLVFAVGPGTGAALTAQGFAHVDTAAGDSVALVARLALLARDHDIQHVFQLAGAVSVADLAAQLAGKDIAVTRIVVYHADLAPLPDDLLHDIASGAITDVVLLSARVAEHLAPVMSQAPVLPRLYCLSARIADVARRVLMPATPLIRVAPQPLLSSLVPLLTVPPLDIGVAD